MKAALLFFAAMLAQAQQPLTSPFQDYTHRGSFDISDARVVRFPYQVASPSGPCLDLKQVVYAEASSTFWVCRLGTWTSISGTGVGTVTSVALTAPNIFSVTGSPITASGTFALALATQPANTVWAGPTSGGNAAPGFRAIVINDIAGADRIGGGNRLLTATTLTPSQVLATDGSGNIITQASGINQDADLTLTGANVINTTRQTVRIANASVTGTTLARIARLTGNPGTAVTVGTSDTEAVGIVTAGAGTTGSADIAIAGRASCEFDAARTAGNFVQISTTLAGRCRDAGSTRPTTGGIILGRVVDTAGSASAGDVLLAIEPVGGSASIGAGIPENLWVTVGASTTCNGSNQDLTYTIPAGIVAVGDSLDFRVSVSGPAGGGTATVLLAGTTIASRLMGGAEGLYITGAISATTTTAGLWQQFHMRENGLTSATSGTVTATWANTNTFVVRMNCTSPDTYRLMPRLTLSRAVSR